MDLVSFTIAFTLHSPFTRGPRLYYTLYTHRRVTTCCRFLHGQTRALPLSSTTCSARTNVTEHNPAPSPSGLRLLAPERSSDLKRYSPGIHDLRRYSLHNTAMLDRPVTPTHPPRHKYAVHGDHDTPL